MLALLATLVTAASAHADDSGEAAFHNAELRLARGEPGAIAAFEAVGTAHPDSAWADDAWLEAGRAAERAGDYVRARRDVERALAVTHDDLLARRARAALARLAVMAGGRGQWSAVAVLHERLEAVLEAGGDPKPALVQLEALIAASPGYPRAWAAMLEVARGWERDGDTTRALAWLRRAK